MVQITLEIPDYIEKKMSHRVVPYSAASLLHLANDA